MRLQYALERDTAATNSENHPKRGYMVIRPDAEGVAQFVRFHQQEDLADGENLLRFHGQYRRLSIVPDSFFFQEGHAEYSEDAKFGVFKFNDEGEHLLQD